MKTLLTLNYDENEIRLIDGRVSIHYASILEQLREDENATEIICGDNPSKRVVITIADTEHILEEWKNLSVEDKAFIVDTAIYLDADNMTDNGTIDYGDIQTAIIFGA